MPEYGQPIENDLNFKPLLDLFRGKGKKEDKKFDGSQRMGGRSGVEMTPRTPEQRAAERDFRSKFKPLDKNEEVGMQPEKRKGAEPAWAKTNPAWRNSSSITRFL